MHTQNRLHTKTLIVASCLLAVASCGDKKKTATKPTTPIQQASSDAVVQPKHSEWIATVADLPECNQTNDGKLAWVAESKLLYICHGNEWTSISPEQTGGSTPGTPSNPGSSAGALTYLVVDASGKTIGRKSLDLSACSFEFSDGAVFKVNPINGGFSGEQCVYSATDCSGSCLFPASSAQKNKLVQGANGFYRISGSEVSASNTYSAYTLGDFPAPMCSALGSTQTGNLSEMSANYNFVDAITYPLAGPISVKPE